MSGALIKSIALPSYGTDTTATKQTAAIKIQAKHDLNPHFRLIGLYF